MKARIGEKAIIGDFKCHSKVPRLMIEGEPVAGVLFKHGRNKLLLCLTGEDADRFEVGAKYALTLVLKELPPAAPYVDAPSDTPQTS